MTRPTVWLPDQPMRLAYSSVMHLPWYCFASLFFIWLSQQAAGWVEDRSSTSWAGWVARCPALLWAHAMVYWLATEPAGLSAKETHSFCWDHNKTMRFRPANTKIGGYIWLLALFRRTNRVKRFFVLFWIPRSTTVATEFNCQARRFCESLSFLHT